MSAGLPSWRRTIFHPPHSCYFSNISFNLGHSLSGRLQKLNRFKQPNNTCGVCNKLVKFAELGSGGSLWLISLGLRDLRDELLFLSRLGSFLPTRAQPLHFRLVSENIKGWGQLPSLDVQFCLPFVIVGSQGRHWWVGGPSGGAEGHRARMRRRTQSPLVSVHTFPFNPGDSGVP